MKGLILSGGHGVRLRPITYSQQKQLIPVVNKPILFYCIEDLINAGIKDIGIIVGPNREQVMESVRSVDWDARIEFIYQDRPGGLAHAVKTAREYLGNDRFIMYLGDNLLKGGSKRFIDEFRDSSVEASLLLTEVDNPEQYGLALVDEQKKIITKLLEKPKNPPTNLSIVGIYGMTPKIFEAIDSIKPSWRNELEITDALQWLIENGRTVKYGRVEGWWKDTGRPEDLLDANRLILEDIKSINEGTVENSSVKGKVVIGKGSVVKDSSVIMGPAIIGENCVISGAYIGPHTSIGNKCRVERTEVENSIVMENTRISDSGRIVDSLIGKDIEIKKEDALPKGRRFVLGDGSQVIA
jgi:glucose-1-phosphate thymidylyltransferase